MITLDLIGIGTGNPDHLTFEAAARLAGADLVLLPRKGTAKADLADLRREICARVLAGRATPVAEFDMPQRDAARPDYLAGVDAWHAAIADAWATAIAENLPGGSGRVALLVWGDPSLYDSSLRIAERLRARGLALSVRVVPGITSLQMLAAAHAIPLNRLGAPFLVTTGRRLRESGWPAGVDSVAVMLDGGCAFASLPPEGLTLYWSAYLGLPHEVSIAGPLAETGARVQQLRADLRARHGWIMDIYLLRRDAGGNDEVSHGPATG